MLGRAADNLFWMARNIERAENIIRLIRTSRRADMISNTGQEGEEAIENIWMVPLQISGDTSTFIKEYGEISEGRVSAYLLTDKKNPGSVRSLIANARENARATRYLLTSDVWECINRTWLHIENLNYSQINRSSMDDYLELMIDRSYMFKGAMVGSMRRGEGLQFSLLGQNLERADHTARLLAQYFGISQSSLRKAKTRHPVGEYYHAMVLLNALNAYKAYRETFTSSIELEKIAELLILHKEVPRSLRACVNELAEILRTLNPTAPVLKDVYNLQYRLQSVQITQLLRVGLDNFLIDFSKQIDETSLDIQQDFMMVL